VSASTYSRKGAGWIVFAGSMLWIAGVLNVIDGVAAISDSKVYSSNAEYIVGNLHTWGWVHLILGVLLVVTVFGIWAGNEWARWVGIVVASLNAIGRLLFIPAYPFWSLALFAIDLLIIYGLATYGGRSADTTAV
jgi:hypothetical protein